MAVVTKAEPDGRHPASHYLIVGDPQVVSTWHLRYKNAAGEIDRDLCGNCHAALLAPKGFRGNKYQGPDKQKAIARLKAIYTKQGWDWPDSAKTMGTTPTAIDLADVATFALPADDTGSDDDVVRRTGLIFKAGDYRPTRDFAITPEELAHVAQTFAQPVPLELEHLQSQGYKTFLDGKIGWLTAIWTDEDGAALFGDVEVPRWLDRLWAEAGRKVSTAWDTAADGAKRLVRLGLVLDPVVQEAALFAEYAAFAGQRHSASDLRDIQQLHDLAHEIHSVALKQGAGCPDPAQMVPGATPASGQSPQFAHSPQGDNPMPDDTPSTPATPTTPAPTPAAVDPTQFAELQTAFARMKAAMESEVAALKAKNTELETRNQTLFATYAEERGKRVQSEATAFADAQVAALKAWPHQRDSLIMRYVVAVNDDANHGLITFGENQQTSRLQLLIDEFAKVEPHKMTKEQVQVIQASGQTQLFGLPNPQETPGASRGAAGGGAQSTQRRADIMDQLLASSTQGQQVLKERQKANGSAP